MENLVMIQRYFFVTLFIVSLPADATEVKKTDWVQQMTTVLPVLLCQTDQYFRQCFNVNSEVCERTMSSAARVCLRKYEDDIPDALMQPEDGTRWGKIVGKCVGASYEAVHINKKKTEDKCDDISYWQK